MTEFPEHDKIEKFSTERSIILKFVDWIEDNNMVICFDTGDPTEYVPIKDEDRLIDTFFGINTDVLKKERKNILESEGNK